MEHSSGKCQVWTSEGLCASTSGSRRVRRLGFVACGTHRSQYAKHNDFRTCGACGLPIKSGKDKKVICGRCFVAGCQAMTTEGVCGLSLADGRGGVRDGVVLCRGHQERPSECDACGGLLPANSGVGSFSDIGRWCSDDCQLAVKYQYMIDNSFEQQSESFDVPCRIFSARRNEKGYPSVYGRFGGVQVWLGHRLAWFHANGVTAADMAQYSMQHLDHMCQNTSCFEPSHMQWLDFSEHSRVTWDRHTSLERAQRAMRIALGHILEPTSATFEWNGHRVTITPV